MKIHSLILAFGMAAGAAQSATIDFSGNICGGGGMCGNSNLIDQGYGDTADVSVDFDGDIASAGLQDLHWWGDYSDLNGVAWGGFNATSEVRLEALGGSSITLVGFDLGTYLSRDLNSQVTIFEIGNATALFSTGAIVVGGLHTSFDALNYVSTTGFQIQWGPGSYNVGIDNIEYLVNQGPTPVPLPATGLLLGIALLGLGRLRRKST